MENRIKDYLHLYLGCEVDYMILDMSGYNWDGPYRGKLTPFCLSEQHRGVIKDVKPILRKLSDMSEEEAREYLLLKFNVLNPSKLSIQKHENGFWYAFKEHMPVEINERRFIFIAEIRDNNYPEQTLWLLSKGFDLFNLIDSGLAIDKNSLTPREQVNK